MAIPYQQVRLANIATPTVKFLTYNSTGMSPAKCQFIKDICVDQNVSYLSIQEHFKWTKMTSKFFSDNFDLFNTYVIPAYRPKLQVSGRAKGGLAQFSLKNVDIFKDRLVTKNWRIQAQVLKFPKSRLLWINTYLPTDPLTVQFDDSELLAVLNEVESTMENNEFDDILWNGDLNWHMSRASGFSTTMKAFLVRLGLRWEHYQAEFTHVHTDDVSTSTLDHFIVNERLLPLVKKCEVIHRGDNMSRHSHIVLELDVGALPTKQKQSSWLPRKPAWYKATLHDVDKYKADMQDRLQSLAQPHTLCCSDPKCSDPEHTSERDKFVLDILCSVVESSHLTIPLAGGRRAAKTGQQQGGSIPGWSEEVQPFRDLALFWHSSGTLSG